MTEQPDDIWERYAREMAAHEEAEKRLDEEDILKGGATAALMHPVDLYAQYEEWHKKRKALYQASTKARATLANEQLRKHLDEQLASGAIPRPTQDGETFILKGAAHSIEVKFNAKPAYDQQTLREIDLDTAMGSTATQPPVGLSVKYSVDAKKISDEDLRARINGAVSGSKESFSFKAIGISEEDDE